MRAAVFLCLFFAACDDGGKSPGMVDGGPHDSRIDSNNIDTHFTDFQHCESSTANVTVTGPGGATTFTRMYAGGETGSGLTRGEPGAPPPESFPQTDQTIILFFTNDEIRDTAPELACMQPGGGCTATGVVLATGRLHSFEVPGEHPIAGGDEANTVQLSGTTAIGDFSSPLISEPGRISGDITAGSGDGTTTVTGTYDGAFCPGLVVNLI